MLIEIPDPEVILGIITAFLVGIFGLFFYYKIKPFVKLKPHAQEPSYFERLEYYERQLIDMKIRLDAFEMEGMDTKTSHATPEMIEIMDKDFGREGKKKDIGKPIHEPRAPNMAYQNATEYVLRLITDKPMTSRDIQITLGRSREHTSRLMKKLFEVGYVKRNTNSKPYAYSITQKGKEKLGLIKSAPTTT